MTDDTKYLLPRQVVHWNPPGFNEKELDQYHEVYNDPRFQDAATYRAQVFFLVTLLHDVDVNAMEDPSKDRLQISYEKIGRCFVDPRTHGSIIKEFQKYGKKNCIPGRPYALTDEEVGILAEELKRCEEKSDYPAVHDIISFIYTNFDKVVSRTTVVRIVTQKIKGYKLIKSSPIEIGRWEVQYNDIVNFYHDLESKITHIPTGFVFNLDESGEIDYVDAHDIHVFVPDAIDRYEYPIDRSAKRISLLHCIATDGTSCTPLIVIPRKTVDNEVYDHIAPHQILIRYQPKGTLTADLFTEWFMMEFLGYLTFQRNRLGYNGPALILMDGFAGHDKSLGHLKPILEANNIEVLKIPEHSSNQVQPLDLIGFNLQKSRSKFFNKIPWYTQQTNRILSIIFGVDYIRSSYFIYTAFQAIGIYQSRLYPKKNEPLTHIVKIEQNKFIRKQNTEKQRTKLTGSTTRFGKFEKITEPNEIYPKRKEIHVDKLTLKNQWDNPKFLDAFNKTAQEYRKSGMIFYRIIKNPSILQKSLKK